MTTRIAIGCAWPAVLGACLAVAADSDGAPEAAGRPVPRFVTQALPEEYRVQGKYFLSTRRVLYGRDCVVALVCRILPPRERAHPFDHRTPFECLGWLGIDIPTGDTTFLTLVQPDSEADYRFEFGPAGNTWSDGTCALELRLIPRGAEVDPFFWTYPGEERELWGWTPACGAVRRLGRAVPLANLSTSLIGTDYRVEWSDRDAKAWNGNVRLIRRSTSATQPFVTKHLVPPPETAAVPVMASQQFGPTEDRRSIIIAEGNSEMETGESSGFAIWRFDLEAQRTVWSLDRAAIEKTTGGRITEMHLVEGPLRPCDRLPILIHQKEKRHGPDIDDEADAPQLPDILWTLDVRSGRLDGPFPMPWEEHYGAMAIGYPRIAATPNGELVANYCYTFSKLAGMRDFVALYDTTRKHLVAKVPMQPVTFSPVGFVSAGRLVLSSGDEVRYLAPPYSGQPQSVFRLYEERKKGTE